MSVPSNNETLVSKEITQNGQGILVSSLMTNNGEGKDGVSKESTINVSVDSTQSIASVIIDRSGQYQVGDFVDELGKTGLSNDTIIDVQVDELMVQPSKYVSLQQTTSFLIEPDDSNDVMANVVVTPVLEDVTLNIEKASSYILPVVPSYGKCGIGSVTVNLNNNENEISRNNVITSNDIYAIEDFMPISSEKDGVSRDAQFEVSVHDNVETVETTIRDNGPIDIMSLMEDDNKDGISINSTINVSVPPSKIDLSEIFILSRNTSQQSSYRLYFNNPSHFHKVENSNFNYTSTSGDGDFLIVIQLDGTFYVIDLYYVPSGTTFTVNVGSYYCVTQALSNGFESYIDGWYLRQGNDEIIYNDLDFSKKDYYCIRLKTTKYNLVGLEL